MSTLCETAAKEGADPQFVRSCVKAFSDYVTGRMPKRQFDEACLLLQQTANTMAKRLPPPAMAERLAPPIEPAKVA